MTFEWKRQSKIYFCLLLASLFLALRCTRNEPTDVRDTSNTPPEILSVSAVPTQIGKRQSTTLSVEATDEEKDEIHYAWSAAAGVFLQGTNRKYAIWQAPDALGSFECTVAIDDGEETTIGKIRVEVVEVAIVQISTDALDYSYDLIEQTLTLENIGKLDLSWQAAPVKTWIQANPSQGVLASGEKSEIIVGINRDHLASGAYTELLGIRSNGGNRDVALYLDVATSGDMVYIPAGEFTMGSADGSADELPVHTVLLDEYWIDKYEVTNAQYADFLNQLKPDVEIRPTFTGVKKDGNYLIYLWPIYREQHNVGCPISYSSGRYTVERHEANTPVRFVTWYGALVFAQFYGKRLPTEAEWEKAARGTRANIYPWGDAAPTRWYSNYDDRLGYLTKVGSYSPLGDSPYGCADMAGNIWEWCSSCYKPYPYQANDGRENLTSDDYRVLRGGSWDSPFINLRCALRSFNEPLYKHPSFGFRCAR